MQYSGIELSVLLPYEDSEQSDRDNEMESDGSRKSDKGSDSISIAEIDRDEVEDVRTICLVLTPFSFSFLIVSSTI